MLVLGRKQGQRVRITSPNGDHYWVMVCRDGRDGGTVRLGFEFDAEYKIGREDCIKRPGVNHDGGPDIIDGAPSDGWIK